LTIDNSQLGMNTRHTNQKTLLVTTWRSHSAGTCSLAPDLKIGPKDKDTEKLKQKKHTNKRRQRTCLIA
jgi:hypothetical protein